MSFNLIRELYFERVAGSEQELKAANIIAKNCKKLGQNVEIEEFFIDNMQNAQSSLIVDGKEIKSVPVGITGSTNGQIEKEVVYFSCFDELENLKIEDKICLNTNKSVGRKIYSELLKRKAAALILCNGSVYDKKTILSPYLLGRVYKLGEMPTLCIATSDAEKIIRKLPKKAKINIYQEKSSLKSYNVISEIKGSEKPDEIICFSAHYDSVAKSKGAYDNASGCACIMKIMKYFTQNPPARTLRFIWCGSEERSMFGSEAYLNMHKEDISKIKFNINIDMIGVIIGTDMAKVTAHEEWLRLIKDFANKNKFPLIAQSGLYSSDSNSFAYNGIPAISFFRNSPMNGAQIHSAKDVISRLSAKNFNKTTNFIIKFSKKLINAKEINLSNEIPQKMKEELDKIYDMSKEI